MKYSDFKRQYQHLPVILSKDIQEIRGNRQIMRNQLSRWQTQGLIVKLKRGMYMLNKNDRRVEPGRPFIANQLHAPSYVSLEYALNFYGLIPERVADVTSVTTQKTMRFSTAEGTFIYQHIKPAAFRGFKTLKDETGLTYFMAFPEKAVVDFIYLNLEKFKSGDRTVFDQSYRFQNLEDLNKEFLMEWTQLYGSPKLIRVLKAFCSLIEKEKVS